MTAAADHVANVKFREFIVRHVDRGKTLFRERPSDRRRVLPVARCQADEYVGDVLVGNPIIELGYAPLTDYLT